MKKIIKMFFIFTSFTLLVACNNNVNDDKKDDKKEEEKEVPFTYSKKYSCNLYNDDLQSIFLVEDFFLDENNALLGYEVTHKEGSYETLNSGSFYSFNINSGVINFKSGHLKVNYNNTIINPKITAVKTSSILGDRVTSIKFSYSSNSYEIKDEVNASNYMYLRNNQIVNPSDFSGEEKEVTIVGKDTVYRYYDAIEVYLGYYSYKNTYSDITKYIENIYVKENFVCNFK